MAECLGVLPAEADRDHGRVEREPTGPTATKALPCGRPRLPSPAPRLVEPEHLGATACGRIVDFNAGSRNTLDRAGLNPPRR